MTVSSTTTKVSYSGNGSTTVFAYTFKIFAAADLTVIVRTDSTGVETTKTLTADYTVSGAGNAGGGNVTMTTAPASGETLLIKRKIALTQSTDYVANDPFPAASHEDALDRLTFIAQEQQEVFDRAVVLPETDTASTVIPNSVTRANKFLGFDSSGNMAALESTGTAPGAIGTANLVDGAVTTAKLAADSVTSAKIVDGTIATADIADDAVTQAKVADDAIGTDQIADSAVSTAQISDGSITAAKLASGAAFSAGMLMPYAGTSAPTGWLLAYGQAVSRTTYADLFSALGTTYGSGDGSTTFNVPDLRGRAIAGQDDMGGSSANRLTNQSGGLNGDTLGATGGSETHTLTTAQMPSHSHTLNGGIKTIVQNGGSFAVGLDKRSYTTNQGESADGTFNSSDTSMDNFSVASNGSGNAHNNVQPTIILNYIIKT